MHTTHVISMGGSIVAPDKPDTSLLLQLKNIFTDYLQGDTSRRVIIVVGGGGPARDYQAAYRSVCGNGSDNAQDWIGIAATRLNAQLVAAVLEDFEPGPVVTDPTADFSFQGRVLVAAGWKPGFSTDYDAVLLAERFGARRVINLSNIVKVYSSDPKHDPNAVPLDRISWEQFGKMVGDTWTPGKNLPFDPIATKKAAELDLQVIVASGRDTETVRAVLFGEDFTGTVIGPEV